MQPERTTVFISTRQINPERFIKLSFSEIILVLYPIVNNANIMILIALRPRILFHEVLTTVETFVTSLDKSSVPC